MIADTLRFLFARPRDRATVRLDPSAPSAAFFRACFAEILASLDERPRRLLVEVHAANAASAAVSVDFADGNPVFRVGDETAPADFRRRWLPEHPVPLVFDLRRPVRLLFVPTSGNRAKVRSVARQSPGRSSLPVF